MPSLKTNYIRTDITSQCFRYQFELISNQPIDSKYFYQIQRYFLSINPFIVFSYPFAYSVQEMKQLKSFNFMLSNGQKTQVAILNNNTITLNSKQVSADIHRQLMKGTNFLYSQALNICLNPFQQRKTSYVTSLMPGFSVTTQIMNNCIGFYLIPIEAKITEFHSLSSLHEHSIVLDYNSGTFYQKSSIVRYDKSNQLIYFRTGEQIKKQYLKSLQILPLSGFDLAQKLTSYFKRIKQAPKSKLFIEKWQIKFDSRFMQLPYNFFPVSHIVLGNKQQKSLGEVIGSISAFNFMHNYRKLLSTSTFDDNMRATIYFLLPKVYKSTVQQLAIDLQDPNIDFYNQLVEQSQQFLSPIISEFENMKLRMNLNDCRIVVLTYEIFVGWVNSASKTIKQIAQIIQKQNQNTGDKIFVLTNLQDTIKQQRQIMLGCKWNVDDQSTKHVYKEILNYFVQNGVYYHLIDTQQNQFKKSSDVIALKTFATIQSKLRLNPWKIKQIPFGTKPLLAASLHVKLQTNGTINVSIVSSLNAFLSKYTCAIVNCTQQKYGQTVIQAIVDSMQKFNSIHKVFPKRAMIFRTGDFTQQCDNEFNQIQQKLVQAFSCKPTYILMNAQSPLRVYNQIDYNYISKDTVKPTQLLCQVRYNNQRFIQLQSDWPMYKINILGVDPQEVNFEQKVVELTTKLCFTYQLMCEMRYGKGLGFISYGQKLYKWSKEFNNIKGMQNHLRQGLLMFL